MWSGRLEAKMRDIVDVGSDIAGSQLGSPTASAPYLQFVISHALDGIEKLLLSLWGWVIYALEEC